MDGERSADGADADPVLFTLLNEIGIIDQLATRLLERHLTDGLTVPQFIVLNHFVRLGGVRTPLQLARAFQVTKGAMTNTLKRLERAGFISVTDDPEDGRQKRVAITPTGRRARQASVAALDPLVAVLAGQFPDHTIETLLPSLRALRVYLDENRDLSEVTAGKTGQPLETNRHD